MVVTCMVLRHRSMQFIGADIFLLGRFFLLDNYPFTKFLGGGGGDLRRRNGVGIGGRSRGANNRVAE